MLPIRMIDASQLSRASAGPGGTTRRRSRSARKPGASRPARGGSAKRTDGAPPALNGPPRLPQLLRRAWHGLNQAFRHRIARAGVTPDQYTVLRILSENSGVCLTQGWLVEAMSSDPNTIASLLRRMERQGWLSRLAHPHDARARCLKLRPAGAVLFARLRRVAESLQQRVLAPIPAGQRLGFLEQLRAVSEACWQTSRQRGERGPMGRSQA